MSAKITLSFLLPLLITGCTAVHGGRGFHLLMPGDPVTIAYTCRTPGGALAAATGTAAAVAWQTLSPIFVPQKTTTPVAYIVPAQAGDVAMDPDLPMEEKIEHYLLRQAAGKPLGEELILIVVGELFEVTGGDRYLPMRKKFRSNRRVTMPVNAFRRSFAVAPAVGLEKESKVPGLSARVVAVQGDQVEILYSARQGTHLPSVFGEQTVTQTDDHLEMETKAREGALVRSNSYLVGKITQVTEDGFVVDYGHAFGFVTLTCQTIFNAAASPSEKVH